MRGLLLLITIVFVSKINAQTFYDKLGSVPPCSYHLENLEPLTDGKTKYRKAILSPNVKLILLFGKKETQIMEVNSRQIIIKTGYNYDGQWINDSLIMFHVHNNFKLFKVFPKSNNETVPIPQLEFINDHILEASKDGQQWTIANIEGNENLYCFGYLFSNDFQKVVIFTNSGKEYIYYLNGNGLISVKEFGISSDWADDNTNIISFLGLDYGEHYTVESDLYIHNTETRSDCKLTDSKNILEKYPSWSGDKIAFTDEKTGIVYIADIMVKD